MKKLYRKIFLVLLLSGSMIAGAQEPEGRNNLYIGVGGGFHQNSMKYSNLDKTVFPTSEALNSGLFTMFLQYETGNRHQFAVRPEFAFLHRGGMLTDIGKNLPGYDRDIENAFYSLDAKYFDFRVPFIFNVGPSDVSIRPYIYAAPVVGLSLGGHIKMQEEYKDGMYFGYGIDVTKANLAAAYLAAAVGLGFKYQFFAGSHKLFLNLEASYEHGLTETYSKMEKDGSAQVNPNIFPVKYVIEGNRKFSGLEVRATLAIPFGVFKKKQKPAPRPAPPVVTEISVRQPEPETMVEEKACYTLEEIREMMRMGTSVAGKTICAVNSIYFDFNKSTIKPESFEYLDALAEMFIRTRARIEVKGHTDNVGTEEVNMRLSKARAESVMDYLVKKGVDPDNITYSYYGMSRPLTTNDTEEGRIMNRRVEFEIL